MTRVLSLVTLILALLAAPLAAEARPAGKVLRIAYVGSTPPTLQTPSWNAFLQGLRDRDWVEGQNIVIEQRYTEGPPERFPELMAAVLQIPVNVIVVADSQAAWAAKRATSTTPIILANVADAMRQGLIASHARDHSGGGGSEGDADCDGLPPCDAGTPRPRPGHHQLQGWDRLSVSDPLGEVNRNPRTRRSDTPRVGGFDDPPRSAGGPGPADSGGAA